MNRVLAVLLMAVVIPSCSKQSSNEESSLKNDQPLKRFVSSVAGLNLRENSDMKSKIITTVSFGKEVTVLSESGDELFLEGRYGRWCNISFDNKTGWVFSGFLSVFNPVLAQEVVYKYYKDKYSKSDNVIHGGPRSALLKIKMKDIKIKSILDNYIMLLVPSWDSVGDCCGPSHVIWKYVFADKTFIQVYSPDATNRGELLYLNNDHYPDVIIREGESMDNIKIMLGSNEGLILSDEVDCSIAFERNNSLNDSYGQCSETNIICRDGESFNYLRFNCKTNKLEVYKKTSVP